MSEYFFQYKGSRWLLAEKNLLNVFSLVQLILFVFVIEISVTVAHAEIIADTNAPKNQQPVILKAPNEVPVVNIQTPSAAGVSRNTYSKFNVQQQGAILNNSRNNAQTELGGWIQGNPYLANGGARIILNEVNSSQPSLLNGYLEVAGSSAQLVFANPAGISCNGCGFINASRTTLTTGTPMLIGGNLMGYRVVGGLITINGNGMDTSRSDYTDIIARAVAVNAGIWANDLKITTGIQDVDHENSLQTPLSVSATPAISRYALDVSALGGMYAGKITLIGTEAGLGVRNAGALGASAGELSLDVNGWLTNSGQIMAQSTQADMRLSSSGLDNQGIVNAQNNLLLNSNAEINNAGILVAGRELMLTSSGQLNNQMGSVRAKRLDISAQSLNNTQGSIEQTGLQNLQVLAQQVSNSNYGAIGRLPLSQVGISGASTSSTVVNNSSLPSTALASGQATLTIQTTSPETLPAGIIHLKGDLDNNKGQLLANGNLQLTASNGLQNSAYAELDHLAVAGAKLNNSDGQLWINRLTLNADELNNSRGKLTVANRFTENTNRIINVSGEINLMDTDSLRLDLSGDLDNSQGKFATNASDLILNAQNIHNSLGNFSHAGIGALTLSALQWIGTQGTLNSNGRLSLTSDFINLENGNTSAQQITFNTTQLNNRQGYIIQTGTAPMEINVSSNLDNQAGIIASNGNATIKVDNLNNQAGKIKAAGTSQLNITATSGIANSMGGKTQVGGTLNLQANNLNNTQGTLTAGGTLNLHTQDAILGINNSQGSIRTAQDLNIISASLDNQNGQLLANDSIYAQVHNDIDNRAGVVAANQVNMTSASLDNSGTNITQGVQGGTINLVNNSTNNQNGHLVADNALQLTAIEAVNNNQGIISSGGTLTLQDKQASSLNNNPNKTLVLNNEMGVIKAGIQLNIDVNSLNGAGTIQSNGNLNTQLVASYNHSAGSIWQAKGAAIFNTLGDFNNQGQFTTQGDLSLKANSLTNQSGAHIIAQNTSLNIAGILNNRGFIDGSNTLINANSLDNQGTGQIYGDHLAINVVNMNNLAQGGNGATVAARERLDIAFIDTLNNLDHSLLFSAGDMSIGGALDTNNQVNTGTGSPQGGTLNNTSATIETLGDMRINAAILNNKKQVFSFERRLINTVNSAYWEECDPNLDPDCDYFWGKSRQDNVYQDIITNNSQSANLIAGNNLNLTVQNTTNLYSTIAAGGNLNLVGNTLTNTGAELYQQTDSILTKILWHWNHRYHGTFTEASSSSFLIDTVPAVISAGGNLTGSFTGNIDNQSIRQHSALSGLGTGTQVAALNSTNVNTTTGTSNSKGAGNIQIIPSVGNAANSAVATLMQTATLPNSSLYSVNASASSHYLIETNPRFANYRTWLSSDYMLKALSYDPATITKRLGDGFYEQRLIREQISQLTGKRFLAGYENDEAQYRFLMNNGVLFAQAHQLLPGVALTAAQMAMLTSDIVWLVSEKVTLEDGSTAQVFVPKVYTRLQSSDLNPTGALLAANQVSINTQENINNTGTLAGRQLLSINANNINVIGGVVQAGDALIMQAKQDINLKGSTQEIHMQLANVYGSSTADQTLINRPAAVYVTAPGGVMIAQAGRDINLNAADISQAAGTDQVKGRTVLRAGRNLTIGTLEEQTQTLGQGAGGGRKGWRTESTRDEIGSQISVQGDIALSAGNNLTIKGSEISSSQGALAAQAGNDISIEASTSTYAMEANRTAKSSGFLSSKKSTHHDKVEETSHTASTLSAKTISLNAGNNASIHGSNVVASQDLDINATNNVQIETVANIRNESHSVTAKKSGFSASGSSVSYGSSKLQTTNDTQTVTNVGSTVGSVAGDVNINAGKQYTQTGSDLITPQGDINISAQSVEINAATDTYANQQTMKYKQSGITVGVSNPVIAAAQTANQMKEAASNTSDPRMQALAAATTALSVKNAADAVQADSGGNLADQAGGISLNISIGSSSAKSNSNVSQSQAKASHVEAGGDVRIQATGSQTEKGNITVTGSQIKAGQNVTLDAENALTLQAAQNNQSLQSSNKSSGASVGISINLSTGTVTPNIGINSGRGKANGNDITYTETQVSAGNQVTLQSGTDTTFKGAQVRGEQVTANVGTSGSGNLTIQSLQDTSSYQAKQKNGGISLSVGANGIPNGGSINAGKQNINSDYASVNEQSGIYAGDGGFQLNVNGNTDLKGAVIASTNKAIQDNKNSLTTQTLTTSTIENKAEYDAKGMSVEVGVGVNQQPNGGGYKASPSASAGVAELSGDSKSTTFSGISGGIVTITDNDKQQALTGKDTQQTLANLNRDVQVNADGQAVDSQGNSTSGVIKPIFDQQKVEKELNAQLQITYGFSQQVQQVKLSINKEIDSTKSEQSQIKQKLNDPNLSETERNQLIDAGLAAQNKIEQLEKQSLLFSALSGALSAPTTNLLGISANGLAPIIANQIGQYFKDHGTEGGAAHILAHGLLSGAVAQLGGNNPLGAAIAGMTAELTAPLLADYLYGKPVNELSAEEKSTISILTSVAGMTSGSVVDNGISNSIQSYQSAQNAVENNWGMVGHYSTMATVLYLAGFSPKDAKAIALAALAPDTDERNAMSTDSFAPENNYQNIIHLLDSEKDPKKVIEMQQKLAEQARLILLTIKQYESDSVAKAAYLTNRNVQNLLHAFGDSFAHVDKDGMHYPSGWGHAVDSKTGKDPDNPNSHSEAFVNYVNTLFNVATQATDIPRVSDGTIKILVNKVTSSTTEKGQVQVLNSAIGGISPSISLGLVNSPVKDCGALNNCSNKPVGSQVNPKINSIYGISK